MTSCGMREYIKYLCQHKMIDCIVTSCGGLEEDFMKCMTPHYMGDFFLNGKDLRLQGINRIGNLVVPNATYCKLESFVMPEIHKMYLASQKTGETFTPSKIINWLG